MSRGIQRAYREMAAKFGDRKAVVIFHTSQRPSDGKLVSMAQVTERSGHTGNEWIVWVEREPTRPHPTRCLAEADYIRVGGEL
jgi:hypothetical protein